MPIIPALASMGVYTCIISEVWEVEAGARDVQDQPGLHSEIGISMD